MLLKQGGQVRLLKQFDRVERCVFVGMPVEELVGEADLVKVDRRVPLLVERLSSNDLFDRIPVERCPIGAARLCLHKLTLASRQCNHVDAIVIATRSPVAVVATSGP